MISYSLMYPMLGLFPGLSLLHNLLMTMVVNRLLVASDVISSTRLKGRVCLAH